MGIFIVPLLTILISRFLLNLRQVRYSTIDDMNSRPQFTCHSYDLEQLQLSDVGFRAEFVTSGAPIDDEPDSSLPMNSQDDVEVALSAVM
ncbi:hypothetical protein AcV7_005329 [Taiwanofungus camphoratus]|nr:hypothetical protein AcV7_005329 [Antrodia cinnamomea]